MERTSIGGVILAALGLTAAGLLVDGGDHPVRASAVTPSAAASSPYLVLDNQSGVPQLGDSFIDASSGTAYTFTGDDTYIEVSAPFAVDPFGEGGDTDLRIHDNGYLTIGTGAASQAGNAALPAAAFGGDRAVAVFWDDLFPKAGTEVYTLTTGTVGTRTFVVEWNDIGHFDDQTASYQFEVVFFENRPQEVLIQYGTMTNGAGTFADGSSATVGVQGSGIGAHSTLSVNTGGLVASSLSISFDIDPDRDGLANAAEDKNRDGVLDAGESDPNDFDTDDGGTGDGSEVLVQSTDPQVAGDDAFTDGDSDGLADNDEAFLGTDPAVGDTDFDGLSDGVEFFDTLTDPLDFDTDDDLLTDFDEVNLDGDPSGYQAGVDSDPNDPDTDDGGEMDGAEVARGRDPNDGGDDRGLEVNGPYDVANYCCSSRRIVDVAMDASGNVHVVSDERNSDYQYMMLDSDGNTLIGTTDFDAGGGDARYVRVLALPSGHVAMVWTEGRFNGPTGGVHYRLIDPALDDQNGNSADTDINPDSPPTVGNGVTLVERVSLTNPGGSSEGWSHLDADVDGQGNIHVVFILPNGEGESWAKIYYAKLKGEGGSALIQPMSVVDIEKPDPHTDQNTLGLPVHRHQWPRVVADSAGYAHISWSPYPTRPTRGTHADLRYIRVAPGGTIDMPATDVVAQVDGHATLQAVAPVDGALNFFHSTNVERRQSGEIALTRRAYDLSPLAGSRVIDGASVNGVTRYYREPAVAVSPDGKIGLIYHDRFHDSAVRFSVYDSSGNTVLAPRTVYDGNSEDFYNRRCCRNAVDSSGAGRFAAAFYSANTGELNVMTVDIGDLFTGLAIVNVTVAGGGVLRIGTGVLAGTEVTFGASDTTADTYAIISSGTSSASPPGLAFGQPIAVSFETGGAALAASADYTVRMPVPAEFTGNTANLSIYQAGTTSWTQLTTTVDTTTTPNTLVATATALTTFQVFEGSPTMAFSTTPGATAIENQEYTYAPAVTATAAPVFSLTTAPTGMSVDPETGAISWTPTTAQLGLNSVTLHATNGFASADQSWVVYVGPAGNVRPVFTSSPPVTGEVGVAYSYTPDVVDPNVQQTLSFMLFTAPTGMTIDTVSGAVSWTPTDAQRGANPVSIGVSDGLEIATQAYTVVVPTVEQPDNSAPQFTTSPALLAMPGEAYSYTAQAIDDDGDTITYALVTAPSGMTIDGSSGAIAWTPGDGDAGRAVPVSITATDGTATVAQIYAITVGGEEEGAVGGGGCCSVDGSGGAPAGALVLAGLVALVLWRPRRRRD